MIDPAAESLIAVVHGVKPDQLDAPTPCTAYDVRALVNHLLFWGPSLEAAGRKEDLPPPAAAEPDVDLTQGDWAAELVAQLERTATAWSLPAAWQGSTTVGGPPETPAATIGGMLLTELVVHGWDLAQATRQEGSWDAAVLEYVHRELEATASFGRELGLYGPEVPVSPDAPRLHRILGLSGRQPK